MVKNILDNKNMDDILDKILIYLKEVLFIEDNNFIDFLMPVDIFFNCFTITPIELHNYTEPQLFLEKLKFDGYVNYDGRIDGYQINFNGVEFINNGGYKAKRKSSLMKKYWNILKVIVIIINAIIVLYFSYSTYLKDRTEYNHYIEKKGTL